MIFFPFLFLFLSPKNMPTTAKQKKTSISMKDESTCFCSAIMPLIAITMLPEGPRSASAAPKSPMNMQLITQSMLADSVAAVAVKYTNLPKNGWSTVRSAHAG